MDEHAEYEPSFDRLSLERRVLGFVTDEEHAGHGPRNTPEAIALDMATDENSPQVQAHDALEVVSETLESLADAGLVARRDDETYELTEAGEVELRN